MIWRLLHGLNESDWVEEAHRVGTRVEQIRSWVEDPSQAAFAGRGQVTAPLLHQWQQVVSQQGGGMFFPTGFQGGDCPLLVFVPRRVLQHECWDAGATPPLPELKAVWQRASRVKWELAYGGRRLMLDEPVVMGILNVTPDSFSDGGQFYGLEQAVRRAEEMIEEGARIIDIGGESTRPGARPVPLEEEWQRIGPVLRKLVTYDAVWISVDTYKSEIARRALEEGAHLINDISGLRFDPRMREVIAHFGAPVVIMHIQGTPRNMQKNPTYHHLMAEVYDWLAGQVSVAREAGIEQILIDPGIGFGKRWEDNFELIRRIGEFRSLGLPVLLGASRKSFLGKLLGVPPAERVMGGVATTIYAALQGAKVFRVHDVKATVHALRALQGLLRLKCSGEQVAARE